MPEQKAKNIFDDAMAYRISCVIDTPSLMALSSRQIRRRADSMASSRGWARRKSCRR